MRVKSGFRLLFGFSDSGLGFGLFFRNVSVKPVDGRFSRGFGIDCRFGTGCRGGGLFGDRLHGGSRRIVKVCQRFDIFRRQLVLLRQFGNIAVGSCILCR